MARTQRLLAVCLAFVGAVEFNTKPAGPGLLAKKAAIVGKHRHKGTFIRTFGLSWDEDKPVTTTAPLVHSKKTLTTTGAESTNSTPHSLVHSNATKASASATNSSSHAHSTGKSLRAGHNSTNATKHATTTTTTTPAPPMAGHIYEVDNSSDPHDAWRCIQVRESKIKGAGRGLFATCNIHANTLIGEYRGMRFMMGERGSTHRLETDWSYIWKVPRCLAPPTKPVVITRTDKFTAHKCSGSNGFVYVDALPMDDEKGNPLRFVNGVRWVGEKKDKVNETVEAFFADDRVWYYTKSEIKRGDEFIVDYGPSYWADATNEAEGGSTPDFGADWGDFVRDS